MEKEYKAPVTIQVYLGSGKAGERLRENIMKLSGGGSVSSVIVKLLRKAEPRLFQGVDTNGK